jgi:hypothetical protein
LGRLLRTQESHDPPTYFDQERPSASNMSLPMELARLVLRQAGEAGEEEPPAPTCDSGNAFDGRIGIRVSSIFVILVGSTLGKGITSLYSITLLTMRRRGFSRFCEAEPKSRGPRLGFFHCQILWLGCDYRHGFHTSDGTSK